MLINNGLMEAKYVCNQCKYATTLRDQIIFFYLPLVLCTNLVNEVIGSWKLFINQGNFIEVLD